MVQAHPPTPGLGLAARVFVGQHPIACASRSSALLAADACGFLGALAGGALAGRLDLLGQELACEIPVQALGARLLGKKVILSTHDFHYAVGRFMELLPDGKLRIVINTQEVLVSRTAVARIREADRALAEYIK